ncbi:hypothetical protein Tco_0560979 [Tanacetum coccineum]
MEDVNKSEGKLINGLPGVQLIEEEEKAVDNVGWKPFLDYVVISEGLEKESLNDLLSFLMDDLWAIELSIAKLSPADR